MRDIIVETLSCDAADVKPETNLIEDLEADSPGDRGAVHVLQEEAGAGIATRTWRKFHTCRIFLTNIKSKQA